MTKLVFLLAVVPLFAFAKIDGPNFSSTEDGCLILSSISGGDEKKVYGENCKLRSHPCSTFKVALAEIAFKNQKINEKGELFKWDGKKREREVLNKDQDLGSWMKDSVVWVSSIVVDRIRREKIKYELSNLRYGNALVGSDNFWILGPLAISAEEQIEYLTRQSADKNHLKALELLSAEKVGGFEVFGKTGSCLLNSTKNAPEIGWFIGRAKSSRGSYSFALRYIEKENHKSIGPAGLRAKALFLEWLQRASNLYP